MVTDNVIHTCELHNSDISNKLLNISPVSSPEIAMLQM